MFDNNKIEAFLTGRLAEKEAKELQHRIDTDAKFAAEVDAYAVLFSGFKSLELEAFEAKLSGWEAQFEEQTAPQEQSAPQVALQPVRNFRRWSMGIAAAIAILVLPLSFLYFSGGQTDHLGSFLAEASAPSPIRGTAVADAKTDAYYSFNQDDYAGAIVTLEQAIVENQKSLETVTDAERQTALVKDAAEMNYVLGMALLKENKAAKAENAFRNVLTMTPNGIYADASQWLLALTLEEVKKDEEAKRVMQEIANSERHDYKNEAQDWLANH